MTLRAGMQQPRDMLEKLHEEHSRLQTRVTSGDLMNFAFTAYHMIEWIRKAPSAPAAAKGDLSSMYDNSDVRVARDITNESKHFELKKDYKDRVTDKTIADGGWGAGRFGAGPYGVGEESIVVVLLDGTRFDSLAWAKRLMDAWEALFAKHAL